MSKVISIRIETEISDKATAEDIRYMVEEAERAVRYLPRVHRVRFASHVARRDADR